MNCSQSTSTIAVSVLVAWFTLACTSAEKGGVGGTSGVDGGVVGKGVDGARGNDFAGTTGQVDSNGTGGSSGAATRLTGSIDLVQQGQLASAFYTVHGGFARISSATQPANGIVCTASTVGACLVSACTMSDAPLPTAPDAGAPTATALDAGMITVTGAGASKAVLTFGATSAHTTQLGYADVSSQTQFFSGGDTITVAGMGGADLPAFAAQSVIAPNAIVLSGPACAGVDCNLDRTQDLAIAWTGGGAGKVRASFETVGSTATGSVFCTFDAAVGMGTVPSAALAVLGDTRDGSATGVAIFGAFNETTFAVGGVQTTFSVQSGVTEALISVTK